MRAYLRLLEIQPGGWLLLSVLYFFGDVEWLIVVLGNVLIHEMGHLHALRRYRVKIRSIRFDLTGFCICCNESMLAARKRFIAAAAGPLWGMLCALVCSVLGNAIGIEWLLQFAGTGAVLSAFNLLPAKPLDGWRMLRAFSPKAAECISALTAFVTMFLGLVLMFSGYGPALAFIGIILMIQGSDDRRCSQKFKFIRV